MNRQKSHAGIVIWQVMLAGMFSLLVLIVARPGLSQDLNSAFSRYQAGDYIGAIEDWKAIARAGNPDALYNLGQVYRLGRGVEPDMELATYYYRRAAEAGHPQAQGNLATIYYFDPSDPSKKGEAITWWRLAARKGHPWSQYMIAILHFEGDGVPQDYIQAFAWIVLAREAGVEEALAAERTMRRSLTVNEMTQGRLLSRALVDVPTGQFSPLLSIPDPLYDLESMTSAGSNTAMPATPEVPPSTLSPSSPGAPEEPEAAEEAPAAPTIVQGARSMDTEPVSVMVEGWQIQLGAFRAPDGPDNLRSELEARHPTLFDGLAARVVQADLGERGVYYRLLYGFFESREEARAHCDQLAKVGQGCVIVAP